MKAVKLGQVCQLHYGKAIQGYQDNDPKESPIRVYGTNGPIGWTKTALIEQPTIIVGRKGAYRGVHFSKRPSWTIDTAYFLTATSNDIDLEWLYYRLLLVDINRMDTGAAIPSTKREDFYAAKVHIPSRGSQIRIASILSAYDDLIENNRRRIQLLEQSARMLYKEWFVHLRFPGHERVKIKDGVPEGWEKRIIQDVAGANEQSYSKGDLPEIINYIDISSVSQGRVLSKTDLYTSEAPARARRRAKHGDTIWSNVRPNLRGYSLVLDPAENDVFSTGFTVLTARTVPFTYLYQFLTTDGFVSYLVNHTTGASYPAVRPKDFEKAEILVPTEPLLDEFHQIVEPHYCLISSLVRENEILAMARDLLLPRLMSGQLAV